jgi:hypothetical protein
VQVARAGRQGDPGDELVVAARLVERQLTAHAYDGTPLESGLGAPRVGAEHHPPQLRRLALVVEREVYVSARRALDVRELSFDPDVAKLSLEARPHRAVDLGYPQDRGLLRFLFLEAVEEVERHRRAHPTPKAA